MSTLRTLAMLAMAVGCAQTAVLAEEQAPAWLASRGGVVASAAAAEPRSEAADIPVRCPYLFGSHMPAGTFCVYAGVAWNGSGEVCAKDVVVIWSSLASRAPAGAGRAEKPSGSNREVYVGFVADPDLVVRAIVDPQQSDRAELFGYTLTSNEAPHPLVGLLTLRAPRLGSADVLSMDLRQPQRFSPAGCAFAAYSGTFLGVVQLPSETTISVDSPRAPH